MALLRLNGFSPDDFAHVHPGGVLGRKLLLRVRDLMIPEPLPLAPEGAPPHEAVEIMTGHRGVCITTDGREGFRESSSTATLGRLMKNRADILNLKLSEVAVRNPATVSPWTWPP
jgi:arabinose-5-phosphate isomerase